MSKVDIGQLKKLAKNDPKLAATLAFARIAIVTNSEEFGEYMGFMVVGENDSTPEIIISKKELRKFATEVLERTEEPDNASNL